MVALWISDGRDQLQEVEAHSFFGHRAGRELFRRCIGAAGAFAGHGVPAFLHVRRGDFFELVLEHPLVAEGVGHAAAAETVELIGEGHEHAGARRDGAVESGIGVFHHQAKGDGGAAERGRGFVAPLRVFLREHDQGAVDQEFGMDDLAGFFIGLTQILIAVL